MNITRSSKCSLKFANPSKSLILRRVLQEYGLVVNYFINVFWNSSVEKSDLLASIVNSPSTWLTARLRKTAAREAIDMIRSVQNKKKKGKQSKPVHLGKRMYVSSTIAELQLPKTYTKEFDAWLHLASIGDGIILNLPIKYHRQYNKLFARGKRLNAYIITEDSVQFCFEVQTGCKCKPERCIGIDTGIKALATTSTGLRLGTDIEECLTKIKRKQHGSKGQLRARRALRQRIDEVAKEVTSGVDLVVVEDLTGITKDTRKRLGKNIRFSIGSWNVRYWLNRVHYNCEDKNVSYRTVRPEYTSQKCFICGYTNRRNRKNQGEFCCLNCGRKANADFNAAQNILERFLTGQYGAGCKAFSYTKK